MDNTIYVQWSDDGHHIRKWSRGPFEGAVMFHQSETGAALTSDGREAGLIAALSKIMPITFDNGPDYMSLYFGGGGAHSTQAMTMHPQDWYDLQTAYEAALAQPVEAGEDG